MRVLRGDVHLPGDELRLVEERAAPRVACRRGRCGVRGGADGGATATARTQRTPEGSARTRRVRAVRGEGRGVSMQYGGAARGAPSPRSIQAMGEKPTWYRWHISPTKLTHPRTLASRIVSPGSRSAAGKPHSLSPGSVLVRFTIRYSPCASFRSRDLRRPASAWLPRRVCSVGMGRGGAGGRTCGCRSGRPLSPSRQTRAGPRGPRPAAPRAAFPPQTAAAATRRG